MADASGGKKNIIDFGNKGQGQVQGQVDNQVMPTWRFMQGTFGPTHMSANHVFNFGTAFPSTTACQNQERTPSSTNTCLPQYNNSPGMTSGQSLESARVESTYDHHNMQNQGMGSMMNDSFPHQAQHLGSTPARGDTFLTQLQSFAANTSQETTNPSQVNANGASFGNSYFSREERVVHSCGSGGFDPISTLGGDGLYFAKNLGSDDATFNGTYTAQKQSLDGQVSLGGARTVNHIPHKAGETQATGRTMTSAGHPAGNTPAPYQTINTQQHRDGWGTHFMNTGTLEMDKIDTDNKPGSFCSTRRPLFQASRPCNDFTPQIATTAVMSGCFSSRSMPSTSTSSENVQNMEVNRNLRQEVRAHLVDNMLAAKDLQASATELRRVINDSALQQANQFVPGLGATYGIPQVTNNPQGLSGVTAHPQTQPIPQMLDLHQQHQTIPSLATLNPTLPQRGRYTAQPPVIVYQPVVQVPSHSSCIVMSPSLQDILQGRNSPVTVVSAGNGITSQANPLEIHARLLNQMAGRSDQSRVRIEEVHEDTQDAVIVRSAASQTLKSNLDTSSQTPAPRTEKTQTLKPKTKTRYSQTTRKEDAMLQTDKETTKETPSQTSRSNSDISARTPAPRKEVTRILEKETETRDSQNIARDNAEFQTEVTSSQPRDMFQMTGTLGKEQAKLVNDDVVDDLSDIMSNLSVSEAEDENTSLLRLDLSWSNKDGPQTKIDSRESHGHETATLQKNINKKCQTKSKKKKKKSSKQRGTETCDTGSEAELGAMADLGNLDGPRREEQAAGKRDLVPGCDQIDTGTDLMVEGMKVYQDATSMTSKNESSASPPPLPGPTLTDFAGAGISNIPGVQINKGLEGVENMGLNPQFSCYTSDENSISHTSNITSGTDTTSLSTMMHGKNLTSRDMDALRPPFTMTHPIPTHPVSTKAPEPDTDGGERRHHLPHEEGSDKLVELSAQLNELGEISQHAKAIQNQNTEGQANRENITPEEETSMVKGNQRHQEGTSVRDRIPDDSDFVDRDIKVDTSSHDTNTNYHHEDALETSVSARDRDATLQGTGNPNAVLTTSYARAPEMNSIPHDTGVIHRDTTFSLTSGDPILDTASFAVACDTDKFVTNQFNPPSHSTPEKGIEKLASTKDSSEYDKEGRPLTEVNSAEGNNTGSVSGEISSRIGSGSVLNLLSDGPLTHCPDGYSQDSSSNGRNLSDTRACTVYTDVTSKDTDKIYQTAGATDKNYTPYNTSHPDSDAIQPDSGFPEADVTTNITDRSGKSTARYATLSPVKDIKCPDEGEEETSPLPMITDPISMRDAEHRMAGGDPHYHFHNARSRNLEVVSGVNKSRVGISQHVTETPRLSSEGQSRKENPQQKEQTPMKVDIRVVPDESQQKDKTIVLKFSITPNAANTEHRRIIVKSKDAEISLVVRDESSAKSTSLENDAHDEIVPHECGIERDGYTESSDLRTENSLQDVLQHDNKATHAEMEILKRFDAEDEDLPTQKVASKLGGLQPQNENDDQTQTLSTNIQASNLGPGDENGDSVLGQNRNGEDANMNASELQENDNNARVSFVVEDEDLPTQRVESKLGGLQPQNENDYQTQTLSTNIQASNLGPGDENGDSVLGQNRNGEDANKNASELQENDNKARVSFVVEDEDLPTQKVESKLGGLQPQNENDDQTQTLSTNIQASNLGPGDENGDSVLGQNKNGEDANTNASELQENDNKAKVPTSQTTVPNFKSAEVWDTSRGTQPYNPEDSGHSDANTHAPDTHAVNLKDPFTNTDIKQPDPRQMQEELKENQILELKSDLEQDFENMKSQAESMQPEDVQIASDFSTVENQYLVSNAKSIVKGTGPSLADQNEALSVKKIEESSVDENPERCDKTQTKQSEKENDKSGTADPPISINERVQIHSNKNFSEPDKEQLEGIETRVNENKDSKGMPIESQKERIASNAPCIQALTHDTEERAVTGANEISSHIEGENADSQLVDDDKEKGLDADAILHKSPETITAELERNNEENQLNVSENCQKYANSEKAQDEETEVVNEASKFEEIQQENESTSNKILTEEYLLDETKTNLKDPLSSESPTLGIIEKKGEIETMKPYLATNNPKSTGNHTTEANPSTISKKTIGTQTILFEKTLKLSLTVKLAEQSSEVTLENPVWSSSDTQKMLEVIKQKSDDAPDTSLEKEVKLGETTSKTVRDTEKERNLRDVAQVETERKQHLSHPPDTMLGTEETNEELNENRATPLEPCESKHNLGEPSPSITDTVETYRNLDLISDTQLEASVKKENQGQVAERKLKAEHTNNLDDISETITETEETARFQSGEIPGTPVKKDERKQSLDQISDKRLTSEQINQNLEKTTPSTLDAEETIQSIDHDMTNAALEKEHKKQTADLVQNTNIQVRQIFNDVDDVTPPEKVEARQNLEQANETMRNTEHVFQQEENIKYTPVEREGTNQNLGKTLDNKLEEGKTKQTANETPETPLEEGETKATQGKIPSSTLETGEAKQTESEKPETPLKMVEANQTVSKTPQTPLDKGESNRTLSHTPETPPEKGEEKETGSETPEIPLEKKEANVTVSKTQETPLEKEETNQTASERPEAPLDGVEANSILGKIPGVTLGTGEAKQTNSMTQETPLEKGEAKQTVNETPEPPLEKGEAKQTVNETPETPLEEGEAKQTVNETPETPLEKGEAKQTVNETPEPPLEKGEEKQTVNETPETPLEKGEAKQTVNETPETPLEKGEAKQTVNETPETPLEIGEEKQTVNETPETPLEKGEAKQTESETKATPLEEGEAKQSVNETPKTPSENLSQTPETPLDKREARENVNEKKETPLDKGEPKDTVNGAPETPQEKGETNVTVSTAPETPLDKGKAKEIVSQTPETPPEKGEDEKETVSETPEILLEKKEPIENVSATSETPIEKGEAKETVSEKPETPIQMGDVVGLVETLSETPETPLEKREAKATLGKLPGATLGSGEANQTVSETKETPLNKRGAKENVSTTSETPLKQEEANVSVSTTPETPLVSEKPETSQDQREEKAVREAPKILPEKGEEKEIVNETPETPLEKGDAKQTNSKKQTALDKGEANMTVSKTPGGSLEKKEAKKTVNEKPETPLDTREAKEIVSEIPEPPLKKGQEMKTVIETSETLLQKGEAKVAVNETTETPLEKEEAKATQGKIPGETLGSGEAKQTVSQTEETPLDKGEAKKTVSKIPETPLEKGEANMTVSEKPETPIQKIEAQQNVSEKPETLLDMGDAKENVSEKLKIPFQKGEEKTVGESPKILPEKGEAKKNVEAQKTPPQEGDAKETVSESPKSPEKEEAKNSVSETPEMRLEKGDAKETVNQLHGRKQDKGETKQTMSKTPGSMPEMGDIAQSNVTSTSVGGGDKAQSGPDPKHKGKSRRNRRKK